jgi:hypothetical protein
MNGISSWAFSRRRVCDIARVTSFSCLAFVGVECIANLQGFVN